MPRLTVSQVLSTLLEPVRDDFDRLLADIDLGVRDQRHLDDLEERADAISKRIRAAFREKVR